MSAFLADFTIVVSIWPLAVYAVLALGVVTAMIAVSYVLGERRPDTADQVPYESGIVPAGAGRLRYSVKFYLVAMFFVIFDVESIFIFAWAVAFRELGWTGYLEIVIFMAVLLAALAYLWRLGALDWGATGDGRRRNQT
jgi:NADH-quinone oxidoreductase subunit A